MNTTIEYRLPRYVYDKYIRMIITDGSLEWKYDKYVFRCPICHDSKKNISKKRGALLIYDDGAIMTCKNCGYSHPLWKVLRDNYSSIYSEYTAEVVKIAAGKDDLDEIVKKAKLTQSTGATVPAAGAPKSKAPLPSGRPDPMVMTAITDGMFTKIDKCRDSNMRRLCCDYIQKRRIPSDVSSSFMCCTSGKYSGRLIIPYINKSEYIYFVARDMTNVSPAKYMGLQGVKRPMYMPRPIRWDKTIYILEGEIDSMFILNSISVGSVHNCTSIIRNFEKYKVKDFVFIMDNDKSGYEKASQLTNLGYRTFNWCGLKGKDINECVISGELKLNDNGVVPDELIKPRIVGNSAGDILRQSLMSKILSRERVLDGYKKVVL